MAEAIAAPWHDPGASCPNALQRLIDICRLEADLRDLNRNSGVDEQGVVDSHNSVLAAFVLPPDPLPCQVFLTTSVPTWPMRSVLVRGSPVSVPHCWPLAQWRRDLGIAEELAFSPFALC